MNIKIKRINFIMAMTVFLITALAACEAPVSSEQNPTGTYTVTFITNGGSAVTSQNIDQGGKVAPVVTSRDGHTLEGWYRESGFINKWDFENHTVTSDITLYARWNQNLPGTYTVTFVTNGGSAVNSQNIAQGGKLAPVVTSRDGHTLEGWYRESGFINKWDFDNHTVTSDIILYARWNQNQPGTYTVTFITNGGSAVNSQNIAQGGKLAPVVTSRDGHTLEGWYRESGFINKWDFDNHTVTGDLTLYAKWEQNIDTSVWLWSNQKIFTVTDGLAGDVYYEYGPTWISYTDDRHYEQEYSYTIPYNTYTEYPTYSYSQVGSQDTSSSISRNGNTEQIVSHIMSDITTTIKYVTPETPDNVTKTVSDTTTTITTIYHEESGLILSRTSAQTGISNGTPVNTTTETNNIIELLNTESDVKTFKSYNTTTDGTGAYYEYKVRNGITLEQKYYTSENILFFTSTSTFPDNAVIREKVPEFALYSIVYENTPANNYYQICEVISDSETELKIRVKNNNSVLGVLTSQYETTYTKMSL